MRGAPAPGEAGSTPRDAATVATGEMEESVVLDRPTRDLKVLVLSTWLPKPCGIATYSHDLVGALLAANPQTDYRVVAINDPGDAFAYPPVVRHELAREDLAGLRRAAAYI